jgi:hypothetical protein
MTAELTIRIIFSHRIFITNPNNPVCRFGLARQQTAIPIYARKNLMTWNEKYVQLASTRKPREVQEAREVFTSEEGRLKIATGALFLSLSN